MQTKRWPANAGSRLKPDAVLGRPRLKGQPSSRTGENSPYGMIGGIEETSASFEARSAPRSYPTEGSDKSDSGDAPQKNLPDSARAGNRLDETRTDALVPQPETGKISCVHRPYCGRLSPSAC